MQALMTAILYLGTFLAIGWAVKRLLDRWMSHSGADLDDVHGQASAGRGKRRVFLLGFWRTED